MKKFKKRLSECQTQRDRILYTLKNMSGQLELPHDVAGDKTLAPLYEAAQLALLPPEVRMNYIKKIMNRNDYGNILLERYEDGMAIGMEKGMEKGVDKGIEIAVKKMAESELDAGRIAEIMQISIEKVDQMLSAAED